MSDCRIEELYIIRVREDDEILRANKLGELEQLLNEDERARLEYVIHPISAAIAFIYDKGLVEKLENDGYELLPQQRVRMIERENRKF